MKILKNIGTIQILKSSLIKLHHPRSSLNEKYNMEICNVCGSKHFIEQKVNKIYEIEGVPNIVKDIPALVCANCGEKYFLPITHDKVMKLIHNDKSVSETITAKSFNYI